MSTVYVGSARSDENGKAYSGKAGDQKSGKEVSTQAWYLHSKGWRVFRAVDPGVARMIGLCMEEACTNNLIGYDQWQRHTLYAQAEKVGFRVQDVKVACETDCSALVRVCLAFAGIFGIPESFRTGNMPEYLLKTGAFVELKESKYTTKPDYLGYGDILVTKSSGHTVVVISDGALFEGPVQPKAYALGERNLGRGDEGEDVRLLQQYLLQLNYSVGEYGADGDFGRDTEDAVKAFQSDYRLPEDGIYGKDTHAALMNAIDNAGQPEPPAPDPLPEGGLKVKTGSWNIRTGPGTQYPTAGTVHGGDVLTEAATDGWIAIEYNDRLLWISSKALEG